MSEPRYDFFLQDRPQKVRPSRDENAHLSPEWVGEPVLWPGPEVVSVAGGALVVSTRTPDTATVIVRAEGEIDAATTTGWSRVLDIAVRVLARAPWPHRGAVGGPLLVIDLSAVSFIGASGLAVLATVREHARGEGIELRAVAARRAVCRPLKITGLDRMLRLEQSLHNALHDSHHRAFPGAARDDERTAG